MPVISRVWGEAEARAVLAASAGIGGHAGDFASWGEALAGRGLALAGCDYPGFGSRLGEELPAPRDLWREMDTALRAVRARWPGRPVVLAGESLGALVALDHAARPGAERPDGLVLSSPAIRTPGKISAVRKLGIAWRVATFSRRPLDFTGRVEDLTADPAETADLLADPLRRRRLPAGFLLGVWRLQLRALRSAGRVTVPTLILWGGEDSVASFPAARGLLGRIPPQLRRLEVLPGERHMLSRGAGRARTGALIADWMAAALS